LFYGGRNVAISLRNRPPRAHVVARYPFEPSSPLRNAKFKDMARTLVLGLNPAWQRLFTLDSLIPGEVHRLGVPLEYPSGKGVNCARVLRKNRKNLIQGEVR